MSARQLAVRHLAALLLAACVLAPARGQAPELDATLHESVQMLPRAGLPAVELETTIYRPDGDGPFPVVVINHGKAKGDPHLQARYRPSNAARYFLQRGYAVVVPMRQGFSNSGGSYRGARCDVERNGRLQADDVKAVLDHLATQPWADARRVLVVGQSHGGWTTLALGARNPPGVRGLVNFAGGLRQEMCPGWQIALAAGAASYGHETRLPSLWLYGENDSVFEPVVAEAMLAQYVAAGGKARMVKVGRFGTDAHVLFSSRAGTAVWQPELTRFLAEIGLPSEVQPQFAHLGRSPVAMLPPPRSGFAPLDDEARLPFLRDTGRAGYRTFLGRSIPRAFALSPNGAWAWAEGGEDPVGRALSNCNRSGRGDCRLYAVDDYVVWKESP